MATLQTTPSASEIVPRFTEAPVPVFEYLQATVRRLLHDNLDSVASLSLESMVALGVIKEENVELLSLVDPKPPAREHIQYHEVYEMFTPRHPRTRSPDTTFAIHLAKVPWEAPQGSRPEIRPARRSSHRSYTASEQDGVIVVEHRDMSFGHPTVRHTLEGLVEDPRALGDPLDSPAIALLKLDIERLKLSTPVRTLSQPQLKQ